MSRSQSRLLRQLDAALRAALETLPEGYVAVLMISPGGDKPDVAFTATCDQPTAIALAEEMITYLKGSAQ